MRFSDCVADAVAAACASRTTLAVMLSAGIWFKTGGTPAGPATANIVWGVGSGESVQGVGNFGAHEYF